MEAYPTLANQEHSKVKSDPTSESNPRVIFSAEPGSLSKEQKVVVKVYGLLGYTRYIDLQFDPEHVIPENVFLFENKRYKIASVIETADKQYSVNAVSIEYSV